MFRDKKILVMGLGITGRACLKALNQMPCKVYCYDENKDLTLAQILSDDAKQSLVNGISSIINESINNIINDEKQS